MSFMGFLNNLIEKTSSQKLGRHALHQVRSRKIHFKNTLSENTLLENTLSENTQKSYPCHLHLLLRIQLDDVRLLFPSPLLPPFLLPCGPRPIKQGELPFPRTVASSLQPSFTNLVVNWSIARSRTLGNIRQDVFRSATKCDK